MFQVILIIIIIIIFFFVIEVSLNKNSNDSSNNNNNNVVYQNKITNPNIRIINYSKKDLMTNAELEFFSKMQILEQYYRIVPQLNLGTIVEKDSKGYRNELFKNIDFAIFTKDYRQLLLLIELNDSSHNKSSRKKRDINLRNICEAANIPLMIFNTNYNNTQQSIYDRIVVEINKNISENRYK